MRPYTQLNFFLIFKEIVSGAKYIHLPGVICLLKVGVNIARFDNSNSRASSHGDQNYVKIRKTV